MEKALHALAKGLHERGDIYVRETFIDGTFSSTKKEPGVGKTRRGKCTKVMAVTDPHGLPVAVCVTSASPHEVKLVEHTLDSTFVDEAPEILIGDKAYDSDPLGEGLLEERGVQLVAPHKANRKKPATQDGRVLRCYRCRWKVKRLFAWLHNYRGLVVRYEVYPLNFLVFIQLGCLMILLRQF